MSTRHADYRRSQVTKSADQTSVLVPVDRLTRLNAVVEGSFSPATLPEIIDYLAGTGGDRGGTGRAGHSALDKSKGFRDRGPSPYCLGSAQIIIVLSKKICVNSTW